MYHEQRRSRRFNFQQLQGHPPGFVDGRHYTACVEDVRALKRAGQLEKAIALLLRLVDATEAEAAAKQWGVAPVMCLYRPHGTLNWPAALNRQMGLMGTATYLDLRAISS